MIRSPKFARSWLGLASLGWLACGPTLAGKDPAKAPEEERVEVKFAVVQPEQIAKALKHFGLDDSNLSKRETVSFYDTAQLAFYQSATGKVIFRSRTEFKANGKLDEPAKLTLKIRKDAGAGSPEGAKCESDFVVGAPGLTLACAWHEEVASERIMAAQNPAQLTDLFAALAQKASIPLQGELRRFGPVVNVRVWNKPASVAGKFDAGSKVAAEHWVLPKVGGKPAREIFELSVKVPLAGYPAAAATLRGLMEEAGATSGDGQNPETKTGLVLQHFAP